MMKHQRYYFLAALAVLSACGTTAQDSRPAAGKDGPISSTRTTFEQLGLSVKPVASGLDTPWDLAWGPDGAIWFTERPGRVSRVDPSGGGVQVLAEVATYETGESGLMGMAFHPEFDRFPYVYLSQSYSSDGRVANRIIRMRYSGDSLSGTEVLLAGIPGNRNHDGSRLIFGPDGFLYATTGDAGDSELAQDTSSLAGKLLRLTPEGRPAPGNPLGGAIFSYGLRNPQGIALHPRNGRLYVTEHGPGDNDEVSIIEEGGNYGWPGVRGFRDGDAEGELEFLGAGGTIEPIAAWTPTVAPAGADFYFHSRIPGWNGSFLFTTLKGSALHRLTLSEDGTRVLSEEIISKGEFGRLRDVLVGPDGTVYLATSNRDGRGNPGAADDRILAIRPR